MTSKKITHAQLQTALHELRLIQQAAVGSGNVPPEWNESINQACRFLVSTMDKRNSAARRSRMATKAMETKLERLRAQRDDRRQLALALIAPDPAYRDDAPHGAGGGGRAPWPNAQLRMNTRR